MMKPCKEEKRGLKKGLNKFNLLLIFFLFSQSLFPQIPINGFCKYNCFQTDSGFTNLLMVNFNGDYYSDFVLWNSAKKEVVILKGEKQGVFAEGKLFSIPIEISFIQPLNSKPGSGCFFSSRRKMKAGIYEFKTTGRPSLLKSIEFDSYPDYLSVANVDVEGKNEILVSGGAFKGLSIIYQIENGLTEEKIVDGTSFSQAVLSDLSNDGSPDIAAYDVIKHQFTFFYNDSRGEFRNTRSIQFPERISGLKSFDINLDSYDDLVFASGKSINIWYGDFRSSYENTNRIETRFTPDKYIIGDFNKDGKIDLAYLNYEQSLISVLFGKNEFEFYPEMVYLQSDGLSDIIPYYSRFVNGIAALSREGCVHTITNLSSFAEVVDISIGAKPGALSFFDNESNGITDFCFIDEHDKKIKFVIRNNAGVPANFYSFQLYENHDKIISENLGTGLKNYVCYSLGKKLIEVVKANFSDGSLKKTALYSPGSIKDLKLVRKNENEYFIYIAYTVKNSLNLGTFSYRDLKFSFSEQTVDTGQVYDVTIGTTNGDLTLYYWYDEGSNISLAKKKISATVKKVAIVPLTDSLKIISFVGDLLNVEKDVLISFFSTAVTDYAMITTDTFSSLVERGENTGEFRITSKNDLFFGETRFNGLKKLSVYLPREKTVNRLEFIYKGRNVASTEIAEGLAARSYFIKNMTSKNYHIVYSNTEKMCITIKPIRE
jgi:hypothetical protein